MFVVALGDTLVSHALLNLGELGQASLPLLQSWGHCLVVNAIRYSFCLTRGDKMVLCWSPALCHDTISSPR